jgi:hypothetical protein
MTANLRRALAVGITAALAFFGLLTVPAHSAPTPTPSSSSAPASSSALATSAGTASSSALATSAGTTSSSALATSAGTTSSTPSTSSGSGAHVTAAATTDPTPVMRAASYLSGNLPTADDGTGMFVSAALALSAARSCDYSAAIASLLASIKQQATDYVGNDPVRAANLAIFAMAVGEDPASFGGLNLFPLIAAGTQKDGQVGAYASSYAQSLAVIAYVRAGQPVPQAVLDNLVSGQDLSGAFGYSYGVPLKFYPDYDTTGLAIEALSAAHGDSTVIAKAVAWALSEQSGAGYWPNPYSPVDSTGILGSGLEFAGTGSGNAVTWLRAQQLADGGFPASLDTTTSNVMATADATWLLAGSNLVTVSSLRCSATTADPTVSISAGMGATTLADTGSPEDAPFGPLAVSMIVIGAGMVGLRRRQRQAR